MRTQGSSSLPKPVLRDDLTQREVRNFLRALRTYPDRFAEQPQLSFEQHLFETAAIGIPADCIPADSPRAFRKAAGAD
ncbi:MAG TPA: hypothetical protein VF753_20730 [Terriglobales bacterium]